jgi:hypothetical protein
VSFDMGSVVRPFARRSHEVRPLNRGLDLDQIANVSNLP